MRAATLEAPRQREAAKPQEGKSAGHCDSTKPTRVISPTVRPDDRDRRDHGTGTLYTETNAKGEVCWYGRWRSGKSRPNRKLGLVRKRGTKDGLTKTEAESELRRLMDSDEAQPSTAGPLIVTGGKRLLRSLKVNGLKPTTLNTYESLLKTHIYPAPFGDLAFGEATSDDVEDLLARMRDEEKAAKTILNVYRLLSQLFRYAVERKWCSDSPCTTIKAPRVERSKEIRFLDQQELSALITAVDPSSGLFWSTDRALFLTAALSGLRQGELLALRWCDIDWAAGKIRVRRNYVRGHWVTPKSDAGSRAVPLLNRVAGELDSHFKRSAYQGDDDLVFAHPEKGTVLCHSALTARFKKALRAAAVRVIRFHDLRHTFGTLIAAGGEVALRTLQEWMGHSDLKTTQIYTDYAPQKNEMECANESFAEVDIPMIAA